MAQVYRVRFHHIDSSKVEQTSLKAYLIQRGKTIISVLQPGQMVVLDNASFHKSAAIVEMIEAAGCKLLFLPPYSPDLNKIEKFWARLKHWLRKTTHQFEQFWDAVDNAFNLCPD